MKQTLCIGMLFVATCSNYCFGQRKSNSEPKYAIEDLQDDLKFYAGKLMQYHPDLYLYSTEDLVKRNLDSLTHSITDSMTEMAFYNKISTLSSVIKDGHSLILPSEKITDYYNSNSQFLPLQLCLFNDSLFVRQVYTASGSIPEGARVLSINGIRFQDILEQLLQRQVRDGYNLNYARWIIDNYFREYYSYIFGHPDNFSISYVLNEEQHSIIIEGLPKATIISRRKEKYPNSHFDKQPGEALQLNFGANNEYAILTIKDFHNEILKSVYKQRFGPVLQDYFTRIIDSKTSHLILDLRNNQGGDIENGVALLANILDQPFLVMNKYQCMKNGQLVSCRGPAQGKHQPVPNPYLGKLYVLINGGSFSNSAIVSSCLKVHNRAVFIGEESGGNPHILAGNAEEFELPNTKIRVEIPTLRYVITDSSLNLGRGMHPNFEVIPTILDRLKDRDPQLNFAISLIKQQ